MLFALQHLIRFSDFHASVSRCDISVDLQIVYGGNKTFHTDFFLVQINSTDEGPMTNKQGRLFTLGIN
jgi:hypothetical protein